MFGQMAGVVPELEGEAPLGVDMEHRKGSRREAEAGRGLEREVEGDAGQRFQEVAMAEGDHVGVDFQGQREEVAGALLDVGVALPPRASVPPEVPIGSRLPDHGTGDAVVVSVVDLHQERGLDSWRITGELGGLDGPGQNARVDDGEGPVAESPAEEAGVLLALSDEGDVG